MSRRPVVVLGEAEDELIAADDWYEEQQPGLGLKFREALDEAIERLVGTPQSASPLHTVPEAIGARRVFVQRFPYSIVFIEADGELWIIAVAHHRRRPGYWQSRLPSAPS